MSFSEAAEGTNEKQVIISSDISEETVDALPSGSNKDINEISVGSISYSNDSTKCLLDGKKRNLDIFLQIVFI